MNWRGKPLKAVAAAYQGLFSCPLILYQAVHCLSSIFSFLSVTLWYDAFSFSNIHCSFLPNHLPLWIFSLYSKASFILTPLFLPCRSNHQFSLALVLLPLPRYICTGKQFPISKAALPMVVDNPTRLQMRIDGDRAHIFQPPLFQVSTNSVG